MKQIIVNHEKLQTRVALLVDGVIEEYYIERHDTQRIVGSIFKGRIRNFEPSLQAAFVDIGLEKNAFLHYWDMIPATKELLENEEASFSDEDDVDDEEKLRRMFEKYSGLSDDELEAYHPEDDEDGSEGDNEPEAKESEPDVSEPASTPQNGVSGGKDANSATGDGLLFRLKKMFAPILGLPVPEEPVSLPSVAAEAKADQGERQKEASQSRERRGENGRNGNHGEHRNRRQRQEKRPRISIDDIPKKFSVNGEVIVQVTKGIIGEKGPRVTTNLSIPGKYVVLLPNSPHRGVSRRIPDKRERMRLRQIIQNIELPEGMGIICRTAAQHVGETELQADVDLILEQWRKSEQLRRRRAPVCIY
ncbi:MAG: hypothetical protein D6820_01370, partial [Lentisphaerae bacterium]